MSTRIYVGNLPYSATSEQLNQIFAEYGDVSEATVVMDRDTGQSKGFGFVQMENDDAARNAIANLNGTQMDNRTIRVSEAQARPPRSDSYGGGGSYGGGRRDGGGGRRNDRSGGGSRW